MRLKSSWVLFAMLSVFLFTGIGMAAPKEPTTVAEIALYQGVDRQQMLEEGAKKEGELLIYTTAFNMEFVAEKFQKKYPYIKVDIWRGNTAKVVTKALEEYRARRNLADVIAGPQDVQMVMVDAGVLQGFYSPELASIEEGAMAKAPDGGAFCVGFQQNGRGIGYNTNLITKDQLPKTYQDLLDPQWKGKMAITGTDTGISLVGTMLETYGEDFVKQLAKQDIDVHMVSGRALLDMVVNGEYAFSPVCADSHVFGAQKKGAPVDWIPLEPVHCFNTAIMLHKQSAHPHAAMLFIDFNSSKEGGEVYGSEGYTSPRKDIPGQRSYKKYFGPFSVKQAQEWRDLFRKLFVTK